MKRFIIHHNDAIRRENARQYIDGLDPNRKWRIEIKEYRQRRSLDQNAYIHAVPLKIISEHTGYSMDEIKEYLCGEFTGWNEFEVMGQKMLKPVMTTSRMDTKIMTDFIEWLQWYASSNLNLRIPSPNEWEGEY